MRVSEEQKDILIRFLKTNNKLLSGRTCPTFTQHDIRRKWEELAVLCNSANGPSKDWKSWRKTWQDMYGRVKGKAAKNNRSLHKTGGGPKEEEPFSKLDIEILEAFIKPVSVEGDGEVAESSCAFKSDNINESLNNPGKASMDEDELIDVGPKSNTPSPAPRVPATKQKEKAVKGKKRKAEDSRAEYSLYLEKKLAIKEAYYDKKIKLLEKRNELLEDQVYIQSQLLEIKKKKYS